MLRPSVRRLLYLSFLLVGCESLSGPPSLDHVQVQVGGFPGVQTFLVNDTIQLYLFGYTGSGDEYPAGPVAWTSSDPSIVAVSASGVAVGVAVGTARITGAVHNISDAVTVTVGGTRHRWSITTPEAWTAAGSPHLVQTALTVAGTAAHPATLTIEAGAVVQFDSLASLTFDLGGPGALDVQGTANAPVTLEIQPSAPTSATWIGLTFRGRTPSALRYVTLRDCGRARTDGEPRGCLVVGNPLFEVAATLLIDHVTVENATAPAMILQAGSRFAAGSTVLSANHVHGYIAALPGTALSGFPLGGTFSTIDTNEVRLTRATLRDSLTWPVGGPPFVLAEPWLVEGPHQPVLTIPAGMTISVAPRGALVVGKNGPGGLQIGSEAGSPVTFRAANANGWGGIDIFSNALPSAIRSAVLDGCGTGADDEWSQGCLNIVGNSFGANPAPVLTNVTIRNGTRGAVVALGGGFGAGSHDVNITGMTGYITGLPGNPILFDASTPGTLPSGSYSGNAVDEIAIWNPPEIGRSETWPNAGVPYALTGSLSVQSRTNPLLTIEAGVVIRFTYGMDIGQLMPGGIHAVGTAAEPIVLTGQYGYSGGWVGLTLDPFTDSSSVFDHVIVENAFNGFTLTRDIGPIISNTIVRGSSACGILRGNGVTWTTDFTATALGNTFANNAGGDQCGP